MLEGSSGNSFEIIIGLFKVAISKGPCHIVSLSNTNTLSSHLNALRRLEVFIIRCLCGYTTVRSGLVFGAVLLF